MFYRAFVSSTFRDLKDHRAHVIAELRRANFSVDPMEEWTADTEQPKHFSQARVAGCDLGVLLVALRRGHVPEGETRSITQLEYEAAVAEGMDVLVFLLEEDAPWPRPFDELDRDPQLREWRQRLSEIKGVGFFGLEPDSIKIAPALTRWVQSRRSRQEEISKPIFRVPQPPNPNFTGRQSMLEQLRAELTSGPASARTQAIAGLPGVGKTALALEYAHRYRADYRVVWWIRAEEPAALLEDMAELARKLGLPESGSADLPAAAAAARRWLEEHGDWLLIFDNATEPSALRDAQPRSTGGHVLITSRNDGWRAMAKHLEVPPLQRDASVALLLRFSGGADRAAAEKLAQDLGDLPLALEQAGAFIEAAGISIASYRELYRARGRELRARRAEPSAYPHSVATTYEISFQKLEEAAPEAAELLDLLSFAAPETFPLSALSAAREALPSTLRKLAEDDLARAEAQAAIRKLSLARIDENTLSMHRVVQAVVRDRLDAGYAGRLVVGLIEVLASAFPFKQHQPHTWTASADLLPHILAAVEHSDALDIRSESLGRILNAVGTYYLVRAEYQFAKSAYERALRIDEAVHGPEHPNVAIRVNNLGTVLQNLGDLAGAKAAYERALRIDEAAYGPDHPAVAADTNNLGGVLRALEDLPGAKAAFERALSIDETVNGPEHPTVAIRVNNLGDVLQAQGDLAGARVAYERALRIDEAAYGPDHPKVAIRLINLGSVLRDLGDFSGARAAFERALRINEAAYGPEHPNVATAYNSLGTVLPRLGDPAGAKAALERAREIFERFLGPDHPSTRKVRVGLDALGSADSSSDT
jgi:tetratricopeptide (TPR) repeat protein